MGAVVVAEDVVVKDEEQNELDTMTTLTKDTTMAVTMTRVTVMMMDMVTEDTMDMEAEAVVFGVAEAAADLVVVDEAAVVAMAVVVPLKRKAAKEPKAGKKMPSMHRMRPIIHLRWFKLRTAVVAMVGEAVLDVGEVAGDAEEEEHMSSV